ncbi:MAG: hypothetical protein IPM18_09315 [Phycisphaerales bacterium]|nr:hypothetical protein [Phycisphaerales bacterium]
MRWRAYDVAFDPSGELLVAAGEDGRVAVWRVQAPPYLGVSRLSDVTLVPDASLQRAVVGHPPRYSAYYVAFIDDSRLVALLNGASHAIAFHRLNESTGHVHVVEARALPGLVRPEFSADRTEVA